MKFGLQRLALVLVCVIAPMGVQTSVSCADELDDLFAVLDARADSIIGVPHLKHATSQMTYCIEGMGRSNLIIGGRLIDQIKSLVGVHSQINDASGAAVQVYFDAADLEAGPRFSYVVAVTNADLFWENNFDPGTDAGTFVHENGTVLHGKVLNEDFVMLSAHAELLEQVELGVGEKARTKLSPQGVERLRDGEVFLFGFNERYAQHGLKKAAAGGAGGPELRMLVDIVHNAWQHMQAAAVVVDFDPLAVVLRTVDHLNDDAPVAIARRDVKQTTHWSSIPDDSFLVAMSSDIGDALTMAGVAKELELFGWSFDDDVFALMTHAQFITPAGNGRGAFPFRDSSIVIESPDPMALIAAFQNAIGTGSDDEGWKANWLMGELGAHVVVEITNPAAMDLSRQMALNLILGETWEFTLYVIDGAVVISHGARQGIDERILAARGGKRARFADDPVYASMRGWLPPSCIVEIVIDAANVQRWLMKARLLDQSVAQMAPGSPPVAFGVSHPEPDRVESVTIIPVQVLTPLLDELMKSMKPGGK